MIVTLTVNPSFDRTVELDAPLERGQVQRAVVTGQEPGGKGVNVSRALHAAGCETLAILPGASTDPLVVALEASGIPTATVSIDAPIRSNITLTEPDGTTTKLNDPGVHLSAETVAELIEAVVASCASASWLVLAGSVPPGVPDTFYADLVRAVRAVPSSVGTGLRIAVDSSGAPLAALVASGERVDLVKPNAEELLQLAESQGLDTGSATHEELEADPALAVSLAEALISPALGAVLVTLGSHGAVLVDSDAARFAPAPRIVARSTVGAGDCSLAGYVLADQRGDLPAGRLAQAVAHGAAAASLPGTTVPRLDQTHPEQLVVTTLPRIPAERITL
ncbi:1-phosphofructokinase family hexose kinase [Agreia sp. Leaf283]|uniref:1-phosphofructokinase family hexose kinase n=1 Tax=Agreia sp. Leaf283 TaxID=1736321 RepID=UPI0006F4700B|nr:hexose kinase [Agreia sp. Leaf283]KQP57364.1 1-phosphofructokinase [Agreia sp. Leaf283]